jgi:MYXO-CTERM domain-containing protein
VKRVAACLVALILTGTAPAAAAPLATAPLTLTCGEEAPTGTLTVPPGSSNRGTTANLPATEYLMRLDADVRIISGSSGDVDVTGLVGSGAGAGVTLQRRTARGKTSTHWSTVDLIHGVRSGSAPGGSKRISESDFMPLNAVSPGGDPLAVRMECSGDLEAEATIGAGSAIWPTAKTFPWLRLTGGSAEKAIEAHRATTIPFRLKDIGSYPVNNVTVQAKVLGGRAILVGSQSRHYRSVSGSVHGHFLLIARHAGSLRLELSAVSQNANSPAVLLRGESVPPGVSAGSDGGGWGEAIAAIAAGLAAAGLAGLWWVRRRTNRADLADSAAGT